MNGKVLLILAVCLGLLSATLVYNYLMSFEPLKPVETVEVVVATRKVATHTTVTRYMVERRRLPIDAVHPEAIFDVSEVHGRISISEILSGEQILRSRLLPLGQIPGLSFTIPADKRGMTIAVNEVIGVAGFIKPGDRVDVIATFTMDQPLTITVLENVTVLAIAQDMDNQQKPLARVSTSVTLALSPNQVEAIILADEQGSLRLALRPPEASGLASRQGTGIEILHPLAYAQSNTLATRQEVATRTTEATAVHTPVSASSPNVSARSVQTKPPALENQREIEVIRGTNREVRFVDE